MKITSSGVSVSPDDFRPREPMEAVEVPADGTEATVSNDGPGQPGEQVVQLPPGEFAEPEPYLIDNGGIAGPEGLEVLRVPAEGAAPDAPAQDAAPAPEPAAPPVPPRTPPRRVPPGGSDG